MQRIFLAFLSLLFLALPAFGQSSPAIDARFSQQIFYRSSVGTTGALAIPSGNVTGNVQGWRLCNDGVPGSSTWLDVGRATDPSTDGVRLKPGACFECLQCTAGLLKATYVEGQAAANGYSIIQFHP